MSTNINSEQESASIASDTQLQNFDLNAKGYIQFNNELIINNRYQLYEEILIDKQTGSTAKGRYGSVFKVKDLKDGRIKALKINRIPPADEEKKRQKVKKEMKKKQRRAQGKPSSSSNDNRKNNRKRKQKTVEERYLASCKREIGVLKRISKKNKDEKYPVLVMYDASEYLGHTYMVFPVYDMTLQQHLVNIQRYQYEISNIDKNDYIYDHIHDITSYVYNIGGNNGSVSKKQNIRKFVRVLMHPSDVWAIYHQLIVGLSYVHNMCSVMHLDFKPKNIMINTYKYDIIKENKKLHLIKLKDAKITLIDFSVSAKAPRDADLDEVRFTGNFGTRRYRPPEMIYGGKWNRSVDTYATAMIVLECIRHVPVIDTAYEKHKQQKRNFDICDVLVMIIIQMGFPSYKNHFKKLPNIIKCLFPTTKHINDYLRTYGIHKELSGKKSNKKMDTDNEYNSKNYTLYKDIENAKIYVQNYLLNNNNNNNNNVSDKDNNDNDDKQYKMYLELLKKFEGKIWKLIELYGDNIIKKFKLLQLMNVLKKMVEWEPLDRLKPEEILRLYFSTNKNNNNKKKEKDKDDDDDDNDDEEEVLDEDEDDDDNENNNNNNNDNENESKQNDNDSMEEE